MSSSKDIIIDDIIRYLLQYKLKGKTYTYYIPHIKTIVGVQCNIGLKFYFKNTDEQRYDVHLIVSSNTIVDDNCESRTLYFSPQLKSNSNTLHTKLDRITLSDIIDNMIEIISQLKLDLFRGLLITEEISPSRGAIMNLFEGIDSITFEGDECCVCKEYVNTTTKCNHSLCILCFEQIKIVEDEEEETEVRKCPLCREDIDCLN